MVARHRYGRRPRTQAPCPGRRPRTQAPCRRPPCQPAATVPPATALRSAARRRPPLFLGAARLSPPSFRARHGLPRPLPFAAFRPGTVAIAAASAVLPGAARLAGSAVLPRRHPSGNGRFRRCALCRCCCSSSSFIHSFIHSSLPSSSPSSLSPLPLLREPYAILDLTPRVHGVSDPRSVEWLGGVPMSSLQGILHSPTRH